jgi:hypothetical protein
MNKDDDYKVSFKGATVTKFEANKIGLAFLFGVIGIFTSLLVFGSHNDKATFIIAIIFAAIGYFVVGNIIFKRKNKISK